MTDTPPWYLWRFWQFSRHMEEYVNFPKLVRAKETGYIVGRVIPIDPEQRVVERRTYYALPRCMRARNPKEVETVLWVYSGPSSTKFVVIDKRRQTITFQRSYDVAVSPSLGVVITLYDENNVPLVREEYWVEGELYEVAVWKLCLDLAQRWYIDGRWKSPPTPLFDRTKDWTWDAKRLKKDLDRWDQWMCPKCGRVNHKGQRTYQDCGEPQPR